MRWIVLWVSLLFAWGAGAQQWQQLNDSVAHYYRTGQYPRAVEFAEIALEQCLVEFDTLHVNYAQSLNNLAYLYQKTGKTDAALSVYAMALEATAGALGYGHPSYGVALANMAGLFTSTDQLEEARSLLQQAWAISKQNIRVDPRAFALRLNQLAELYEAMGLYDSAVSLYLKAQTTIRQELGEEHIRYGHVLNDLATLYASMGRYADALPLYKQSLAHAEAHLGQDHPAYGVRLNNLGQLYERMGRYPSALSYYIEAREVTERSLGKDHTSYGIRLNNLAGLYQSMGRYDAALPLYREAVDNVERNLGRDHPRFATSLSNLGVLYVSMDQPELALPLFREALQVTAQSLGKEHPSYGIRLNNLASLHLAVGQPDSALPLCREALAIVKRSLGEDHDDYAVRLHNLALVYATLGNYDSASVLYLQGMKRTAQQVQRIFAFSAESDRKLFLEKIGYNFELYQSLYLQWPDVHPDFARGVFENSLMLSNLLLRGTRDMLGAVQASQDTSLVAKYKRWKRLKLALGRAYCQPLSERPADIDRLEAEARDLEAALVRASSEFAFATQVPGFEEVQQRLKSEEVAITFSAFDYYQDGWTDSTLYVAYVVTTDRNYPEVVVLFEAGELDQLVNGRTPRKLYRTRGAGTINLRDRSAASQAGRQLYNLVIRPLEPYLQGAKRVYFSPAGKLNQLALAALPDSSGLTLGQVFELVQLRTMGQLAMPVPRVEQSPVWLAGGVVYDADTTTLAHGGTWSFLDGTLQEVQLVSDMCEQHGLAVHLLSGSEATESSVKALSGNSPAVIHLSTHGFFIDQAERRKWGRSFEAPVYTQADDPLLRSGLIMAGANAAWEHGGNQHAADDGILTAYEISLLDLSGTDLVVLSACETGLGDVGGSEGVYGLQRAFRMAGVKYLMMSLWEVPDKETVEFMQLFYSNWLAGAKIGEAFRLTQHRMQAAYPDQPDKWAAFVLVR